MKMKLIEPKDLEKILTVKTNEIRDSKEAVEKFIEFFQEYKIKEKQEYDDEDILLFQYGNYDWQDGNGEEFNFDLTRQLEVPNEDEFLQLSLTLFYDSEQIGEIEAFNSWSTECENLKEWEDLIKQTKGYEKIQNIQPNSHKVSLNTT